MSITVEVRHGNVEQAMRILKRKIQKTGLMKEIRDRQYYRKPSEKRVEKLKEKKQTLIKLQKKRDENMGIVIVKGVKKRLI
jgi:small subunit ribosomal protein S21